MTIVPTQNEIYESFTAVRLARYAQIIQYDENRFWGIALGTVSTRCRDIWTLPQRILIAKYLAEAQIEFEALIGYPIGKRWFTELKRPYTCPVMANVGFVIEGGVKAVTMISAGEAVVHTNDPAVIGPVAVSFTDVNEVHIYHPGSNVEIDPGTVAIAGGFLTITIPRCRMVKLSLIDNPAAGLPYGTISNYDATVDLKRVYNDPSTQATLVTNHKCGIACDSLGCSDYTKDACIYVADPEIGKIEAYQARYSGGTWSRSVSCCGSYKWMTLNYRAGTDLNYQTEDAITRLAHSKMPVEPCG